MGKHMLRELRIGGAEAVLSVFPEFDFYRLGRLLRLELRARQGPEFSTEGATLSVESELIDTQLTVVLEFDGVRSAELPRLSPDFYFSEFEIDDLALDQLEGVRFLGRCRGGEPLSVYCAEVKIRIGRARDRGAAVSS